MNNLKYSTEAADQVRKVDETTVPPSELDRHQTPNDMQSLAFEGPDNRVLLIKTTLELPFEESRPSCAHLNRMGRRSAAWR